MFQGYPDPTRGFPEPKPAKDPNDGKEIAKGKLNPAEFRAAGWGQHPDDFKESKPMHYDTKQAWINERLQHEVVSEIKNVARRFRDVQTVLEYAQKDTRNIAMNTNAIRRINTETHWFIAGIFATTFVLMCAKLVYK